MILISIAAFFLVAWGIAHLFPTRSVVKGFGDIGVDNQRIITMEWIIEGVSLIFIGVIVALVTTIDAASSVSQSVYWAAFFMLNILSIISFLTGFKINFIPFKLCPVIFTASSILILAGSYL
jgi:hypothetical protein